MKKILSFLLLSLIAFSAKCENINVGAYDTLGDGHYVYYNVDEGTIMIQCLDEKNANRISFFQISKDKVDSFRRSLSSVAEKFAEWSKIAVENNVESVNKQIDIPFPPVDAGWLDDKVHTSMGLGLKVTYKHRTGRKDVVALYATARESSYPYDEVVCCVMVGEDSMRELVRLISKENLVKIYNEKKAKKKEEQKTESLFR